MPDDKTRFELPVELADRIRMELVELHNASPSALLLTDQEISAAFSAAMEALHRMEHEILKGEAQRFLAERTRAVAAMIAGKLRELGEASLKEKEAAASEEVAKEIISELEKEAGQLDKDGIKARVLSEVRRNLRQLSAPTLAPPSAARAPTRADAGEDGIVGQIVSLHGKLSARAREFGVKCPKLSLPPVITGITPAHLEAMDAVFGKGNLEPLVLPDPNDLDDDYFKMMYPLAQRPEDTERGLIAQRGGMGLEEKFASLEKEAENLCGALIFIETIQKPWRVDLGGFYGSGAGKDINKDALFRIVSKNRFGLTWTEINYHIAPAIAKKLEQEFLNRNLPHPAYEVIIQPALAANLSTVLNHPENSRGETFEWSSATLPQGSECFHITVCGFCKSSANTGASRLGSDTPNSSMLQRGFRLAVVFRK